jgi:tripartite-type tricarboxylate transporter receptor subunit TctC
MKKSLKSILFLTAIALLISMVVGCNSSDTNSSNSGGTSGEVNYPTKPIQIIAPVGAGGDTDRNTRNLARFLEDELGKPIVVSNVGGAGGTVGSQQVLDSAADGYTVLAYHDATILNNIFGLSDFSFDAFEIAGISVLDEGNAFLVRGDSPFNTLEDLISYAKENPNQVTVATEVGAHTYMQLLAFQNASGTELRLVDAGGAADKIAALLGGHVQVLPTQLGLVQQYLESGDMKALGVLSEERLAEMPDVPTFKEQGVDAVINKMFYWGFPKGTPEEIVNKFAAAMEKVITSNEEFKTSSDSHIVTPSFMGPEAAVQYMTKIREQYQELYKSIQ